ncbi:MAG TPA: TIR domain-containing protein [Burkholderiales bacterium]|nr:TIR domain-containing protein [Burkholderiales bacterium]
MATVFISYRREETAGEARALFAALVTRLGESSVFMDVDNIALGRDFRQVLQERLAACDLMLALIGRNWVNAKDASGQRRLDDPGDFVRLEIEAALKRNIPVTPVLLQGATMPTVKQLPESIRDFAYRNGFELSHNRWDSDVQEMLRRLGLGRRRAPGREIDAPEERTPTAPQPSTKPWFAIVGASVAVIGIVAGGLLYYRKVAEDRTASEIRTARQKADTEAERLRAQQAEAESARAQAEKDRAAAVQGERDRAVAAQAERDRAAAQAERDRAAVERKGGDVVAPPKSVEDRKAPRASEPGVKIEKASCDDLGNARYRLHLWGWASGEAGSLVYAGPNLPPGSGTVDEANFNCLGWGQAQPEDGPVYTRACKRGPGNAGRTPWSGQTVFQWRLANPPTNAFAALRHPRTGGADPVTTTDRFTFSCGK